MQKKEALLSWREALKRQTPSSETDNASRIGILRDIDAALLSLGHPDVDTPSDRSDGKRSETGG